MRLILIRHGQTQSNVDRLLDTAYPGAPLTSEGHDQAASLVERLAEEPIEAIFASTLTRAQQTAAPLAESKNLSVEVIDGIQEIAAGDEEMTDDWEPYISMLTSWGPDNMHAKLAGAETAAEFMARFNAAVAEIAGRGHETAALVSHGAALRVWTLAHLPDLAPEIAKPLANTQWIVLNGTAHDWTIERWGETEF